MPVKQTSGGGRWVLLVAIVGSSMAFIDASAVNVALPSIQRDLHAGAAAVQWVIEAYALFLSALILIGGSLGDIFGRRLIFVLGISLFALASLACAAAQNITQLDIARCLQGVGGALTTPGSLALISANFSGTDRGRAIGTWSGFAAITGAIGPLLGGWLAQYASWRDVFLINIPLAAVVVIVARLRVPESRDREVGYAIDFGGAVLATAALGSLTYGLIRLQNGRLDHIGIAAFAASAVLLAVFIVWEKHDRAPMMPLEMFANATFSGANLYTLLLYAALGGSLFFVPFDLQNVQGYSPTGSGAAMLPFIIILFGASRWSGGLVGSIGARIPLIVGAILAGFGFLAYARIGVGGSYWTTFFPASVVLGVGSVFFVAPLTTTVMNAAGTPRAGVASGINNAVSRVAGLIAIAAIGIVLITTLYGSLDRRLSASRLSAQSVTTLTRERDTLATGKLPGSLQQPDRGRVQAALALAYTDGFRSAMWVSALLCWGAAAIAFLTIPKGVRSGDAR